MSKKKRKKKKRSLEERQQRELEMKYNRRAPGEFVSRKVRLGDYSVRTYLQWCFLDDAQGRFCATLLRYDEDYLVLTRIRVEFENRDGEIIVGKENHLVIYDYQPFADLKIPAGNFVRFTADIYPYLRKDYTSDFSLKNPRDISIISEYTIPSDDYLQEKARERLLR